MRLCENYRLVDASVAAFWVPLDDVAGVGVVAAGVVTEEAVCPAGSEIAEGDGFAVPDAPPGVAWAVKVGCEAVA